MELRQLEYLVAVADEAGFTRAADRLHVAQPGISAQIKQLEHELGQPLLDRSGRTVRPTDAGVAVLEAARDALAAFDRVRAVAAEYTGLLRGRVTLGTVSSAPVGAVDLPALLAGFHRAHPGVEVSLLEAETDRLIDDLRGGRIDAAFVSVGADDPAGLAVVPVVDDRLVVVVAPDDPLARRSATTLRALRDRPLIALPHGSGLRRILDNACARAGFRPDVRYQASNPPVLVRLAAQGLGVAVVPESAVAAVPEASALVLEPAIRGRIVLAWRRDGVRSPAAGEFIARARSMAQSSAL